MSDVETLMPSGDAASNNPDRVDEGAWIALHPLQLPQPLKGAVTEEGEDPLSSLQSN